MCINLETKTDVKSFSIDDNGKRQIRDEEKSADSTSHSELTDQVKKYYKNDDEQRITNLSDGSVESLNMIEPPTGGYTEEWKLHIKVHYICLLLCI